jgi:glycosyltransferase involved in cell wall biosynthesis
LKAVKSAPQIPVAIFLTRFEPGGTERQMTELIRRLDPERFAVHVACFDKSGAWLPRIAERAASIVEFPIQGFARPATFRAVLDFASWCRRQQIAVVQTCDLYANIFGLPGAALAGVPVRIGSRRELNPDKTPGQIRLQRQAYRCATKIVANSSAARTMLEQEGVPGASIAVIPNGIDTTAFSVPGGATRSRGDQSSAAPQARTDLSSGAPQGRTDLSSGAPQARRRIITVANLRREKSHETLIGAAAQLAAEFPDVQFQIVGDGPRRAELEALVRDSHLEDRVLFLGHREDVAQLLGEADIFVLPSRSEAFPNGAIEAMAAGLPVVASAVGGLLDLIEPGRTGMLVPPGDAGALAAMLRELLLLPSLAREIGDAAQTQVRQRYSFERMVTSFTELYLAGLAARQVAGARRTQAAGI